MFNNNINKPAIISINLPVAKTSFCRQKLFLPGRFFSAEKTGFYRSVAKTCQPCFCHGFYLFSTVPVKIFFGHGTKPNLDGGHTISN